MGRRKLTRATFSSSTLLVGLIVCVVAGRAYAQAEVAPVGYEPPAGVPVSKDPRQVKCEHEAQVHLWNITVQPRLVIALGDGNGSGLPRFGYGAGASFSRAVLVFGRVRLGLGITFSYERQQHETVRAPSFQVGDTTQFLSHASFSADVKLESFYLRGVLRPWIALGPALSIASYSEPPSTAFQDGIKNTSVLPGLRAGVGIAGTVTNGVEIGGRAEWLATFNGPQLGEFVSTDPMLARKPITPMTPGNFSVGVDVGFRF